MTKIEWTDETINPIRAENVETGEVGWFCTRVSNGCKFCYSATMNKWRGNGVDYAEDQASKIRMFLDENVLSRVEQWKKPRRIFWCDMTDMFHPLVKDEWLDMMFAVMALTPRHTHQILTKRPERMRAYLNTPCRGDRVWHLAAEIDVTQGSGWPLPNVWCGTSIEDQPTADHRIPTLLQTAAAVRWVSYEPALGGVDFAKIDITEALAEAVRESSRHFGEDPDAAVKSCNFKPGLAHRNALTGDWFDGWDSGVDASKIDWIVCGGESGNKARPFNTAWARRTIEQCRAAGVPVFVKQLGANPFEDEVDGIIRLKHKKGGDSTEWSEDLRVREFPGAKS